MFFLVGLSLALLLAELIDVIVLVCDRWKASRPKPSSKPK